MNKRVEGGKRGLAAGITLYLIDNKSRKGRIFGFELYILYCVKLVGVLKRLLGVTRAR